MSQPVIISLAFLAVALGVAAAAVEAVVVAVAKFHFGIEKGVRNQEARRLFKTFQWMCWKAYGFGSVFFSLQDFKGPPYSWLADLSGVVTPLQVVCALVALGFGVAAMQRLRDPYAY